MPDLRSSIHRKLSYLVLSTTGVALLIAGVAMGAYDLRTFKQNLVTDLTAQADILSLASTSALEFDDPQAARDYLSLLQAKPDVVAAAIYSAKGSLFASYSKGDGDAALPDIPDIDGYHIEGSTVSLFKRIVAHHEILGTVYLGARYGMLERLANYVGIVTAVLALSLITAVLISRRLQQNVTRPIVDITAVARRVMEKRDFSSRALKTTDDEIGLLVDAFNGMLTEIDRRTQILEQSNRDLEHEIGERKRAEEALRASDNRLRTLNAELEQRVAARTSELESANQDLESFSYSVSHDLRAPIRAIRGFSSLLIEDHGPALDAEAQRKLNIVSAEAARMGNLIDDLLAFSRLGRRALEPSELDMRQLAQTAFERLKDVDAGRCVDFRLGSLPRAKGDRGLFEQVWANLIANAIKFSSKRDAPVIEVGGLSEESEHVYFVRDNGAGFDPAYRERLFGVFQRLHHDHEFPGTGVGLALVHRIVTRHGGRVWADGELDRGATFHFTLPKEWPDGRV
jgi:signal transduction histidine kinase